MQAEVTIKLIIMKDALIYEMKFWCCYSYKAHTGKIVIQCPAKGQVKLQASIIDFSRTAATSDVLKIDCKSPLNVSNVGLRDPNGRTLDRT